MLGFLEQTIFTFGETAVTGTHILTVVIAVTLMAWTYLKGIPFVKQDKRVKFSHKSLNELREPEFRDLLNQFGRDLEREIVYDRRKVGIADRELTYFVETPDGKLNRDNAKIVPETNIKPEDKGNYSRVSIFYVREDKLMWSLAKKFIGLPQRLYDVMIIPEKYLIDADQLVIDKQVNLVRYADIDTVWCSEVQSLFKAFTSKEISEHMDENIVNFLRKVTHFDVEQAKETQFKEFETEMEKLRWGDKAQRDSSKI